MSIAVQIVCDGCGNVADCGIGEERLEVHSVRDVLRSNFGWKVGLLGGKDLCSDCVVSGRQVQPNKKRLEIVRG